MGASNFGKILLYILFTISFLGVLYLLSDVEWLKANEETPHVQVVQHSTSMDKKTDEEIDQNGRIKKEPNFKQPIKLKPLSKQKKSIKEDDPTEVELAEIREQTTQKSETIQEATNNSLGDPEKYFTQLREEYNTRVMSKIAEGDIRRDVIIRYYNHPPDQNKIYTLEQLGFYIHERPVDGSLISYESNAVFYGDDVNIEELKLVVYYLLKEGMPIKHIAKSQYHDGWKSSSIEIGTDTSSVSDPIITFSRLQSMKIRQ